MEISNFKSPALYYPSDYETLNNFCEKIFVGLQITPSQVFGLKLKDEDDNYFYVTSPVENAPFPVEKTYIRKMLKSSDIKKFKFVDNGNLVYFPYELRNGKYNLIPISKLKNCPHLFAYIKKHKELMYERDNGKWRGREDYYGYSWKKNLELNNSDKIVICGTSSEARFAEASKEYLLDRGSYGIILNERGKKYRHAILKILNSKVLDNFIKAQNKPISGGYYPFQTKTLKNFPLSENILRQISDNSNEQDIWYLYEKYALKKNRIKDVA